MSFLYAPLILSHISFTSPSLDTLSHLLYFSPSTIGPIYFYKVIYSTSYHYFNPLPLDVFSVQARVCVQRSIENCTGDHSGRLCGIGLLSPLSSHAIPSLLYSALSFLLYSALFFLCFSISSTALLSPLFSPNSLESSPFFSLSPPSLTPYPPPTTGPLPLLFKHRTLLHSTLLTRCSFTSSHLSSLLLLLSHRSGTGLMSYALGGWTTQCPSCRQRTGTT